MDQEESGSKFLNTVISCVKQVGPKSPKSSQGLESLYGEAGQLIKNFQTNINRCKRYNEAKINRKYEMIITDLQSELRKVKEKLKIEQDARSPTKRHITDILDQMVILKQQNQLLKKQMTEYKDIIRQLNNKNEIQGAAINKLQNTQPKAVVERLPALSTNASVSDSIKQYLKDKQAMRQMVEKSKKTNLETFLSRNLPKAWNWTIGNLLQELDNWSQGIKPTKQVDMWKIRSSVAKNFSEYLDDSKSLTKPSQSFNSNRKILSPMRSQPVTFNRQETRFLAFGNRNQRSSLN